MADRTIRKRAQGTYRPTRKIHNGNGFVVIDKATDIGPRIFIFANHNFRGSNPIGHFDKTA
jgi:hypothetical protein